MGFNKRHVASHFGQAADTYDEVASVQFQAGLNLIERLSILMDDASSSLGQMRALDLGCGTGRLIPDLIERCGVQKLYAIDISSEMIAYATAALKLDQNNLVTFLSADIEALPFDESSRFSLIFCNFSLQWCNSVGVTLQALRKLVEPGGYIALAVPGLGTFSEIKQAWQQVDGAVHVNQFLAREQWRQALVDAGFQVAWESVDTVSEYYVSAQAALEAIKRSGVTNANRERRRTLLGVQRYRQFLQAYAEQTRRAGQYPLTYETYSFIARN